MDKLWKWVTSIAVVIIAIGTVMLAITNLQQDTRIGELEAKLQVAEDRADQPEIEVWINNLVKEGEVDHEEYTTGATSKIITITWRPWTRSLFLYKLVEEMERDIANHGSWRPGPGL